MSDRADVTAYAAAAAHAASYAADTGGPLILAESMTIKIGR